MKSTQILIYFFNFNAKCFTEIEQKILIPYVRNFKIIAMVKGF